MTPHQRPATLVYEAVVSDRISDTGRLYWYLCDDLTCLSDAQQQADSYLPVLTDLRDATVTELAALSGVPIPAPPDPFAAIAGAMADPTWDEAF